MPKYVNGTCTTCHRYAHACNCEQTEKATAALVAELAIYRDTLGALAAVVRTLVGSGQDSWEDCDGNPLNINGPLLNAEALLGPQEKGDRP